MSVSESQKKATAKYFTEKIDEIKVRVPKGKKDEIKKYAERNNISTNELIIKAIEQLTGLRIKE